MAPNMVVLTKMTILNIHLHCLMKRDDLNRMLLFAKWDINRGSNYEPNNIFNRRWS